MTLLDVATEIQSVFDVHMGTIRLVGCQCEHCRRIRAERDVVDITVEVYQDGYTYRVSLDSLPRDPCEETIRRAITSQLALKGLTRIAEIAV